jgi:acetyl-CoA carboxylase carboxyltransferase component
LETYIKKLRDRKAIAAGGAKDAEGQHKKGRLTAQERIDLLFDPGTFCEIDTLVTPRSDKYMDGRASRYGDGVVTGFGEINGRKVFVASQNAAVMGGSLGEMHANKIVKAMHMAIKYGCPFLALNDSGGARIQEGVDSLGGYAKIFDANCEASGVIPQLSVILGPCAGGAVYSPALTDFVFMTENSYMFITGPEVVKAVMHENVSFDELGGGLVHSKESGVSHFLSKDDAECLLKVRDLLSYLPSNNQDDPPYVPPIDDPERRCPELETIVPVDPSKPYDVRQVIHTLVDDGRFFEVHELWAENMVVGFARLNGYVIGIVANQPMVLAGCIDIKASVKAAHFIRLCDAYNIPIVTLQDVPGFLPGTNQEYGGIIRNGAHDLRLQRGDRAQADDHPAQELRRRLLRDEFQGAARRPALRLAQRRDRRDGRRGCGQHPLPQAGAGGRRPGRQAQGVGGRLRGEVQQPVCRCVTRADRRRDRAARQPPRADQGARSHALQARNARAEEAWIGADVEEERD